MKKYLLLLTLFIVTISSCSKDSFDPVKQASTDDAAIQNYIRANNITATKDPSGLYYAVLVQGTGDYPKASSTVTVNSTGKLLDGTVFDSEAGLQVSLSGVIKGWKIGLQHINTGGRILLMIPSALGYGDQNQQGVPKNSVLIFTVDLLGFHN
ncbi:MAG TPA: FKBP-type peptidyl-prolyl cis-trans isomerase [Mucilaginibacter sp.]|jgi:FKBP-type peptidyl-prolyl cis-trans isomerase FkpA|nr:FKBP-type peptidyl-prolyl cis-trans isomerase [Mucilaginibacter sp.]